MYFQHCAHWYDVRWISDISFTKIFQWTSSNKHQLFRKYKYSIPRAFKKGISVTGGQTVLYKAHCTSQMVRPKYAEQNSPINLSENSNRNPSHLLRNDHLLGGRPIGLWTPSTGRWAVFVGGWLHAVGHSNLMQINFGLLFCAFVCRGSLSSLFSHSSDFIEWYQLLLIRQPLAINRCIFVAQDLISFHPCFFPLGSVVQYAVTWP